MKYRILTLMGVLALSAGSILQAQDYDDIYYDASKSTTTKSKTKVVTPAKTVAVYGEVPERYKEAVQVNYSAERDVDEYNRRGAYDPSIASTKAPSFEVDINGDTIYFDTDSIYDEEAFANTRRIERFYNPDIIILSDDEDLVELYYSETPTINLIVGSDWGYNPYYSSWGSYYYPWYTGWYDPWYTGYGFYRPWYWHSPWHYGFHYWDWGYRPWYYAGWDFYPWHFRPWGSSHIGWTGHGGWDRPHRPDGGRVIDYNTHRAGSRAGLATNRNTRGRVDATGNRGNMGSRNAGVNRNSDMNRPSSSGSSRTGYATSRGGNMGSRSSSGVSTRSSSRTPSYSGGSRSYSSGSSSSGRSYSSGSSNSGRSYSSGSSSSGRSYSSGSSSSRSSGGGGGSHGGSSGGGGRRR